MIKKALPYILLFCLYGIIHKPLNLFFQKLLVEPFFSYVDELNWLVLSSVIVLVIAVLGYSITAVKRHVLFSFHLKATIFLITAIYVASRMVIPGEAFLSLAGPVKLTDLIVLPAFIIGMAMLSRPPIAPSLNSNGFLHDEPLAETTEEYRTELAQVIVQKLLNTSNPKSTFAFAVMGEWGSGKTTILNQIGRFISNEKDRCNLIRFNPWQVEDAATITKEFFIALANDLNKMIVGLKIEVEDYASSLLNESKDGFIQSLFSKTIFLFRNDKRTLAQKQEIIQKAIARTGKKIMVLIDDLDRLEPDEIREVFRIVRNSANFGNLIFIIAFDPAQVENALNLKTSTGSSKYLDKIFQANILMNSYREREIREYLIDKLRGIISEEDLGILENDETISYYTFKHFESFLINIRDVIRFTNLFSIYYPLFKDKTFFPDFYRIMFLRLSFPTIFRTIYSYRNDYFTSYKIHFDNEDFNTLTLVRKNKEGRPEFIAEKNVDYDSDTILYEDLLETLQDKRISSKLSVSFEYLFPYKERSGVSFEASTVVKKHSESVSGKAHLAVNLNKNFDTYFDLDNTTLSHFEFVTALDLTDGELEMKVREWFNRGWHSVLLERIHRTRQFDSLRIFRNILQAIIYASEQPTDNVASVRIYYTSVLLQKILVQEHFSVSIFRNVDEYIRFLDAFFIDNIDRYAIYGLIEELSRDDNQYIFIDRDIFDKVWLMGLLKCAFQRYINKAATINYELLRHYYILDKEAYAAGVTLDTERRIFLNEIVIPNVDSFIMSVILRDEKGFHFTFDGALLRIFNEKPEDMLVALESVLPGANYGEDLIAFADSVIKHSPAGWFFHEFKKLNPAHLRRTMSPNKYTE